MNGKIKFNYIHVFPESKAVYIPVGIVGQKVEHISFYPGGRYSDVNINVDYYNNFDWTDGFATNYHYNGDLLRDE